MFESREPKQRMPPMPRIGPERRTGNVRRKREDRRELIRFEPAKQERRSGQDRRRASWDRASSR